MTVAEALRPLTHVFFDVGGVLGSNGWDRVQRAEARRRFNLEEEVESRHDEVSSEFETGTLTLEEYLESVVFFRERDFSRTEFVDFMMSRSEPDADALAIARSLAGRGDLTLMTMNNESEALNLHRIEAFGLREIFTAFLSSCWLGTRKPTRRFFLKGLSIAQADPATSLFVDDRQQNLCPAEQLGMQVLHYTSPAELRAGLALLGLG